VPGPGDVFGGDACVFCSLPDLAKKKCCCFRDANVKTVSLFAVLIRSVYFVPVGLYACDLCVLLDFINLLLFSVELLLHTLVKFLGWSVGSSMSWSIQPKGD
jgi:hypothetical protein